MAAKDSLRRNLNHVPLADTHKSVYWNFFFF